MSASYPHSSLDSLPSSRRSAVSAAIDLESQHASSVGLARRLSPKLPPLSHPLLSAGAATTLAMNGSRHPNGGSHVGGGVGPGASQQQQPLAVSAFSLLPSASSAAAAPKSSLRWLMLALLSLGCVALVTVGWDHSALTRTPAVVCFDGQTCVPAERNQPHSGLSTVEEPHDRSQDHTATATATAAAFTTTATTTTPAQSTAGPPFHDSLASLLACPPLASILAANKLQATDESGSAVVIPLLQPSMLSLVLDYEKALKQRLSAERLTFDDWRESGGNGSRLTMAQFYQQHADVDLTTGSTRNTNYTISTWSNICLTLGGDKDPHLVLLGSDMAAQQRLIDTQLLQPDHRQFSWLPPRWCNDQGRLKAQAKADDDWLWIAAEEGTAAFHQFEVMDTNTQ